MISKFIEADSKLETATLLYERERGLLPKKLTTEDDFLAAKAAYQEALATRTASIQVALLARTKDDLLTYGLTHQDLIEVIERNNANVGGGNIIIVSLAPVLSLTGIEGKLFGPLAMTIAISLIVSLVLSLTTIPVLATFFMKARKGKDSPIAAGLLFLYRPILGFCLKRRGIVTLLALVLLAVSLWIGSRTGREFLPQLNEGTIVLQYEKIPSISLEKSMAIDDHISKELMALPEIIGVYNRTGSDELRLDPMSLNETDAFLETKPRTECARPRSGRS